MRPVAIGLALRCAATAERRAISRRRAGEANIRAYCVRPGLAYRDEVYGRRRLVRPCVLAPVADCARRTCMRDGDEALDVHLVRMDPRPLDVGEEDLRRAGDAEARVDALLAFVQEREVPPFDRLDAGDHRSLGGRCR